MEGEESMKGPKGQFHCTQVAPSLRGCKDFPSIIKRFWPHTDEENGVGKGLKEHRNSLVVYLFNTIPSDYLPACL